MNPKKGTSHVDQLSRLNKIEGQVRGVSKMIDDQRYCPDILTQLKAIKSAVASVEVKILEQHLLHCLKDAISAKNKKSSDQILSEIILLLKSSVK